MSLLTRPTPDQSIAGKQSRVANRVRMNTFGIFNQISQTYQQLFGAVWSNPMGLTPQQVVAALGTDAAELFRFLTVLSTAVNAATPGTINVANPAGFTVTSNADGTVTISGNSA